MALYPHQQNAVDAALANQTTLIEQACGTGKSRVIVTLVDEGVCLGTLTVVVVPSLALAAQVSTQLEGLGDVLKIDSDDDGTTDPGRIAEDAASADIVLCTYHSIDLVHDVLRNTAYWVLFDECHHAAERRCQATCDTLKAGAERAVYLSATPADGQADACDAHVRYLPSQGVTDGVLKPFDLCVKLADVEFTRGDRGPQGRVRAVAKGIAHQLLDAEEPAQPRRVLVRCGLAQSQTNDGRMVATDFCDVDMAGAIADIRRRFRPLRNARSTMTVRVDVVTADTPQDERAEVLQAFDTLHDNQDDVHILVFHSVLAEGVDTRTADLLVIADDSMGAASWRRTVQLVGRVMRKARWGSDEPPSTVLLMGYLDRATYAKLNGDTQRAQLEQDVGSQVSSGFLVAMKEDDEAFYDVLISWQAGAGGGGGDGGSAPRDSVGSVVDSCSHRPRFSVDTSLVELSFARAPDLDRALETAIIELRVRKDGALSIQDKAEALADYLEREGKQPPKGTVTEGGFKIWNFWDSFIGRRKINKMAVEAVLEHRPIAMKVYRQILTQRQSALSVDDKATLLVDYLEREGKPPPSSCEQGGFKMGQFWQALVCQKRNKAAVEAALVDHPAANTIYERALARKHAKLSVDERTSLLIDYLETEGKAPSTGSELNTFWRRFVDANANKATIDAALANRPMAKAVYEQEMQKRKIRSDQKKLLTVKLEQLVTYLEREGKGPPANQTVDGHRIGQCWHNLIGVRRTNKVVFESMLSRYPVAKEIYDRELSRLQTKISTTDKAECLADYFEREGKAPSSKETIGHVNIGVFWNGFADCGHNSAVINAVLARRTKAKEVCDRELKRKQERTALSTDDKAELLADYLEREGRAPPWKTIIGHFHIGDFWDSFTGPHKRNKAAVDAVLAQRPKANEVYQRALALKKKRTSRKVENHAELLADFLEGEGRAPKRRETIGEFRVGNFWANAIGPHKRNKATIDAVLAQRPRAKEVHESELKKRLSVDDKAFRLANYLEHEDRAPPVKLVTEDGFRLGEFWTNHMGPRNQNKAAVEAVLARRPAARAVYERELRKRKDRETTKAADGARAAKRPCR